MRLSTSTMLLTIVYEKYEIPECQPGQRSYRQLSFSPQDENDVDVSEGL